MLARMGLLPEERAATVRIVRPVDIHGDRYVDLQVELDDARSEPRTGRVPAGECPGDLAPGDHVTIRFVLGVMVKITR